MPPPPTISSVFGAGLVGITLAATLFGIYCAQTYSYFNYYPKDRLWQKLLVVGIWISLALEYALNLHAIYTYLIDDFGLNPKLAVANWDWVSYVLLTSVTAFGVQLFFARRLFYLLHNKIAKWILVVVISSLSLLSLISGTFMTAKSIQLRLFSSFTQVTWGIDLWLGANVACDIFITLGMVFALHTSRTGIKSTDRLINKLIAYSIQTGAITSVVEIFCLATFTASGFHYGHILVIFPLSGLYATSFSANLHARIPNAEGVSIPRGVVITDGDVEMSTSLGTGFTSSSGGTRTATSTFQGNKIKMSFNERNGNSFLDYSLPDEDVLVKAPTAAHNAYDHAGTVV
ncbi:hypothetical protein D9757_006536 [Collybiopsis confluens]|uniref:DUF6534 domain-containing protein n=1 Tax=Collybiopsis confluens TaxID=2823264 RepID=A0A8H5HPZ9_9AGAR|nr:hypothetical protein D9757_006536 [Collybiopsis confluens]